LIFPLLITALLLLPPAATFASEPKPLLTLVTSVAPPYMIEQPPSGLDIDTVRAALEHQGYQVRVEFVSLNRTLMEVKAGRADVAVPSFATADEGLYNGDSHIRYRPTVFSLHKRNIQLDKTADMGRYCIATFQGATGYFGPDFIRASQQSPLYYEHHSMPHLIDMLMMERTDLVVLDYRIFRHYYQQKGYQAHYQATETIFPPVPAMPVFNDTAVRDQFNLGLAAIRSNGSYQAIMTKYGHDLPDSEPQPTVESGE
jgi:polar amino acid transport system substrate-binding protein